MVYFEHVKKQIEEDRTISQIRKKDGRLSYQKAQLSWARLMAAGWTAGAICEIAFVTMLTVLVAGFNTRAFSPADLVKVTLMLFGLFLGVGLALGTAVGLLARAIALIPRVRARAMGVPGFLFAILFVLQVILASVFNPYIFRLFTDPASVLAPVLLVIAVLLGFITLTVSALRPLGRQIPAAFMILVLLMLLVVPFSLVGRPTTEEARALAPSPNLQQPTGLKVVLVGIDGLDWGIADQLLANGWMPNLQTLIRRGVRAPLATYVPTRSPIIWTTIATGKRREEHGIASFVTNLIPFTQVHSGSLVLPSKVGIGRALDYILYDWLDRPMMPMSSSARREKALWNILSEQGLRSVVINWWATWPAEEISGLMVSDRLIHYRNKAHFGILPSTIGLTYPPELILDIEPRLLPPDELGDEVFERYMDIGPEEIARMRRAGYHHHALESEFAFCISMDESVRRIALDLVSGRPGIPFWAIYTRGVDILSHAAMKYSIRVNDPESPPEERRKYGRVLDEAYQDADRLLGDLMEDSGSDTVFIVVSDHGFEKVDGKYDHIFAPPGVVAMAGGPVRRGAALEGPSVYDVTPTVLYLMGLPVADDMSGRVWSEALDAEFLRANPVRTIESYGPYVPVPVQESSPDVDEYMIERLRALGYVE